MSTRKLGLITVLFSTLTLVIYIYTLAPSVMGGDSGEFSLVAPTGGVLHPPGYPLYSILSQWIQIFPGPSVAWRMNLLSALCASLANGLLFFTVSRWKKNLESGFFAAGFFAFSPLVWSYAVVAEVFALNHVFLAGLLFLATEFTLRRNVRILYGIGFWVGLGLTHHLTYVFFSFPILLWALWQTPNKSKIILSFFFGLLPYLYLPWASHRHSIFTWGNQSTLAGFIQHVLRKEYGTFSLIAGESMGAASFFSKIYLFFSNIPSELTIPGSILLGLGIYFIKKEKKIDHLYLGWVILGAWISYIVGFAYLAEIKANNPFHKMIFSRFLLQSELIAAFLLGLGFPTQPKIRKYIAPAMCVWVGLQGVLNYRTQDQSQNYTFQNFAYSILTDLPPQTLLLTSGDHITYLLLYFQHYKGIRPDVRVVDHSFLGKPWYKEVVSRRIPDLQIPGNFLDSSAPGSYKAKDFLDAQFSRSPILLVNGWRIDDESYREHYQLWTAGLSEIFFGKDQMPMIQDFTQNNDSTFKNFPIEDLKKFPVGSWEHELYRLYWRNYYGYSLHLCNFAFQSKKSDLFEKALEIMKKVEPNLYTTSPELFVGSSVFYKYLGLIYLNLKNKEQAKEAYTKYLSFLSPLSPEYATTLKILRSDLQ